MQISRLFWFALASSVLMLIAIVVDGLRNADHAEQTTDASTQKDLVALGLAHGAARLHAVR